jgi:hypothetical protein
MLYCAVVRIANWNVQRLRSLASPRGLRVAEWFRRIEADLWILTETHAAIAPGDVYRCVATFGEGRRAAASEEWVAIWSRWEMSRLDVVDDPIRCVAARVMHPEGSFIVYGTVLPWIGSTWRGHQSGEAFQRALALQAQEWLQLRNEFPDEPLIVAGDFNQDLLDRGRYYGSSAGRNALRKALHSAGVTAVTGGAADPVRSTSTHATIDHVGVSGEWTVGRMTRFPDTPVPDRRCSDHFGISAEVRRSTSV